MSRRTKGEGSYFTRILPSGKTQYVYQYPRSRKRITSCVSVVALKAKIQKKERARTFARGLRLSDYLVRWLDEYASQVRPTTLYRVSCNLTVHVINKREANVLLATLSAPEVRAILDAMVNDRTGKPVAPITKAKVRSLLKQALEDAVEDGLLARNPITTRGVKPPKINKSKARALTPDQAATLYAHIRNHAYEALILVMGLAALRRGEALGLRWSDVDFDGQTIAVERAVVNVPGRGAVVVPTKTDGSVARIPVGEAVIEALRRHRVRQKEMILAAGPNWTDHGYVFTNCIGELIHPNFAYRKVKAVQAEAGVPALGPHALRHTAATLQLASGADIRAVQDLLRHEKASTTLNTYIHSVPTGKSVTAARMDAIYEKATEGK